MGTPQKLTAINGAVVWAAKYSSFGEAHVDGSSTITNNLRFPGQYFDSESGLHYNHHRYYDPEKARYLRIDPIGLNGGINAYIYVFNNPVAMADSIGLCAIKCCNNCQSEYRPSSKPTGEKRVTTQWDWGTIVSMRMKQSASALARLRSPIKVPIPTFKETVVIGQILHEEEWAKYECLVEICLDQMMEPLELGCTRKKGEESWWVLDEEKTIDIKKTYVY